MLREKIQVPLFVRRADGNTYLNEDASQVKGGLLIPPAQSFVIPAATNAIGGGTVGASFGTAPMTILESQSDCVNELLSLIGRFSAGTDADVQARLMVEPRLFNRAQMSACNRPILFNHMFGNQLNPFYLQADAGDQGDAGDSILLDARQYIGLIFSNPSVNGSATISFQAESTKITNRVSDAVKRQIDAKFDYKRKIIPYWFTVDTSIAPGVPGVRLTTGQEQYVFFQNKENFTLILTSIMATVVDGAGVTGSSERFSFELYDSQMDELLTDQPVCWNCGMGNAQYPFRLRAPMVVDPRRNFRMKIKSLTTAGNIDVMITFFGVAIIHDQMGAYRSNGDYVPNPQPVALENTGL